MPKSKGVTAKGELGVLLVLGAVQKNPLDALRAELAQQLGEAPEGG